MTKLTVKKSLILILGLVFLSSCRSNPVPVEVSPVMTNLNSWVTVEDLYLEYKQLEAIHSGYIRE